MPTAGEMQLVIRAKNEAEAVLRGLSGQIKNVGKTIETTTRDFARGAMIMTAVLTAAGVGVVSLGLSSAKTEAQLAAFDRRMAGMGMSGEAMVAALQEASQGLLSNDAIVAGANRAMLTMGEQIASKLPDLMRISILASRELGMSQDEMWNTIIMAISRASPRMLTSMGMLLDIGDDYEIAAQKIGKTAAELTALEQRQILVNSVMGWGATTFGDITQKVEGFDISTGQLRASVANLKDDIGNMLIPALQNIVEPVQNVVNNFGKLSPAMQKEALNIIVILGALLIAFKAFGIGAVARLFIIIAGAYKVSQALAGALAWLGEKFATGAEGEQEMIAGLRQIQTMGFEKWVETELGGLGIVLADTVPGIESARKTLEGLFAPPARTGAPALIAQAQAANKAAQAQWLLPQSQLANTSIMAENTRASYEQLTAAEAKAMAMSSEVRMVQLSKEGYEDLIKSQQAVVSIDEIQAQKVMILEGKESAAYKAAAAAAMNSQATLKLLESEYDVLWPKVEKLAGAEESLGGSISEVIDALVAATPVVQMYNASIAGLEAQVRSQEQAQKDMSAAMHNAQRDMARQQEEVSKLSDALSEAKTRLDELSRPRLVGMGELQGRVDAIQDYINALKLAELTGVPARPPTMPGLPANIEQLERMLEILRLTGEVQFAPLLRQLEAAARPPAAEITFEDALKQIQDTRATISGLEGQLDAANAALQSQRQNMDDLSEASYQLGLAMDATRGQLENEKATREAVVGGLKVAYGWILKNRDELLKSGAITIEQATLVDTKVMGMFDVFNITASDKLGTTRSYIAEVVLDVVALIERVNTAVAKASAYTGGGIPGYQAGGMTRGGLAVVGERGPELLQLPGGTRIYPGVPGGRTMNLTVNVGVLTGDEMAARRLSRTIWDYIQQEAERRG